MNKLSRIFVAGHNGLVGSAIVKTLKEKGYKNIFGATRKELNLLDQSHVDFFFRHEKPEYVILAAAKVGGIVANNTYRADFIYENLQIQNNVIHFSYKYGVKKLLFLGSTCIYPKDAIQPMHETCLLTGELEYTNEPYAIAKIAGIKMCESYNIQYGTNFISVMPTNLYGPNDNFDLETSHVLPAMVRKMYLAKCLKEKDWEAIRTDLRKRPFKGVDGNQSGAKLLSVLEQNGISEIPGNVVLKLWGSGKPMREFLWSEDMAEACVYLMENIDYSNIVFDNKDSENCNRNTHINIGTGEDISIKDLSAIVAKEIGFDGQILFDTTKPDGTMKKLTYPRKLHELGWKHKTELKEGIAKIYSHYMSNNS